MSTSAVMPGVSLRQLVTIRTVSSIRPIPGADAIECATVDGWDVVVKKGEFAPGQRGLYFEIDSFLPVSDERFAFLAKSGIRTFNGKEGVRLRTVKLRGQISQGLLLSLTQFPEVDQDGDAQDLAANLGIEKWEAPIPAQLAGTVKGGFPCFISKTDQERIQNLPHLLIEQCDELFEVTVKLDGSSMTVYSHDGEVGVCTRNLELIECADNTPWRVANRNGLPEALRRYGRNIALQGELIGPGIQKNPEKLKDQEFFVFDVWDSNNGEYLGVQARDRVLHELRDSLGAAIQEVPRIEITTLDRFGGDVHKVLDYANGGSLNPETPREGVVFKRVDGKCSFKAISNAYLLKNDG